MKALMPDISDPSTQERLSPSAILLFANIMEAWGVEDLDAAHLLGDIPLETYRAFRAGSDKGARTLRVYGASANTLDGFRPALP
jgi:hypothetical protein